MSEDKSFVTLGIQGELTEKLKKQGIVKPTGVQEGAIPEVLAGNNLVVQSPTGTGKTLAYLAPLIMGIDKANKDLEVIILAPSRELAIQIINVAKSLTEDMKIAPAIGGTNMPRQLAVLKEKPKILVGTPGRVRELFNLGRINGQVIRTIVVDEVDKMFSAGFLDDVKTILKGTLKTRQVLFFSATIPEEFIKSTSDFLEKPQYINVGGRNITPATISHLYFMCPRNNKLEFLVRLLHVYKPEKAIIFIQSNEGVRPLAGRLEAEGLEAGILHSDLHQLKRRDILNSFRSGKVHLLVTTDLLARGMDIEGVDYIFNFDIPHDEKKYLHRVGRTGRAGNKGIAVTLLVEGQQFIIHKFSRALNIEFENMGLNQNDKVFTIVNDRVRKRVSRDKGV